MANVIEFTIKAKNQLTATMGKINKTVATTAKTMESVGKKTTVAAGAVVAFTTAVANGVDQTGKFSSRIGVAVEELSKMQFVAGQAGIATSQFNMATQRMTRRVAEAAEGMGEARGALSELGVDANKFKGLGLEDQMATLSDAMQKVEAPADRLRLAFKLFDSEGTAMLQMLQGGSEAMRKAAADAKFLGLAISEQAAANAAAFMDNMGRATGSIKGTSRAIADELMPVLTGLANRFADSLAESRESIVSFVKNGVDALFTFGAVVMQVWDGVTESFTSVEGFSAFLDNLGAFASAAGSALLSFAKMIPIVIWEGIKAAMTIVGDFAKWMGKALMNIATGKEVSDFSDAMAKSVGGAFAKAGANMRKDLADPLDEFKAKTATVSKAAADVFGVNMDKARTDAKSAMASVMEFGEVVTSNTKARVTETRSFLDELYSVSADWLSKQKSMTEQYATEFFGIMQSTTAAVADGMAESIVEGKNAAEIFSNIGKQVAKQLIAMWVKVAAQRAVAASTNIASSIAEGAASMTTGLKEIAVNVFKAIAAIPLVGPVLAPAAVIAAIKWISGFANTAGSKGEQLAGARADGGPVTFGKTYLVGERGPELFTPNASGGITSNEDLMRGGRGGGVTIENMTVRILENVTDGGSLIGMDPNDLKEKYAVPLIDAFDDLAKQGVAFEFARHKL